MTASVPALHKGLPVVTFEDIGAFEQWLEAQSTASKGAWVRLGKVHPYAP